MATINLPKWDEQNSNVESTEEFEDDTERLVGFQVGTVARSKLMNTVLITYQNVLHGLLNYINEESVIDEYNIESSEDDWTKFFGNIVLQKQLTELDKAKQNLLTFDNTPTKDSTNPVTSGGVYSALTKKQDSLTFDSTPTKDSSNPVKSSGVYDELEKKLDVSNVDDEISKDSTNPVQSKAIYNALAKKLDNNVDEEMSSTSTNPVQNKTINAAIEDATSSIKGGTENQVYVSQGDASKVGTYKTVKTTLSTTTIPYEMYINGEISYLNSNVSLVGNVGMKITFTKSYGSTISNFNTYNAYYLYLEGSYPIFGVYFITDIEGNTTTSTSVTLTGNFIGYASQSTFATGTSVTLIQLGYNDQSPVGNYGTKTVIQNASISTSYS